MNGHVRETHADCHNISCCVCNLYICKVCGGAEGSLLPVCPGHQLTMDQHDANYAHYCADTGPFAQCVPLTVTAAKTRCYERLHPLPHIDSSEGARILYDAVCELWMLVMKRVTNAASA